LNQCVRVCVCVWLAGEDFVRTEPNAVDIGGYFGEHLQPGGRTQLRC